MMEEPHIGIYKIKVRKLSETALSDHDDAIVDPTIIVERELRWQEKIDKMDGTLFTLVDGEDIPFKHELLNVTKHSRVIAVDQKTIDKTSAIPKFNVVEYHKKPTGIIPQDHRMYIAATLEDKVVILALLEYKEEILYVTPDFSSTWYPITVNRCNYEYKLLPPHENPSQKPNLTLPVTSFTKAKKSFFETTSLGTYRYVVNGSIESAAGFSSCNLFLRYLVELPPGWHSADPETLTGVTAQSVTTVTNGGELALLGQPFELDLTVKIEDSDVQNGSHQPLILVEVMAMDTWWWRSLIQGYGFAFLPLIPGSHQLQIPTWIPSGDTMRSKLDNFFLGKGSQLSDLSYAGIPSTYEESRMSRFGFKARSSGTINLSCHVLSQSSNLQQTMGKSDSALEQWNIAKISPTLHNVIQAFNKAREKLHSLKCGS